MEQHDTNNDHGHEESSSSSHHPDPGTSKSIAISKYTQALIKTWETDPPKQASSPNKISVSQTVSFAAFLYEKMRNAVEFREDHLIRRAAIERIIKRRLILNENARDIAEPLIKELLWARYYENNTIGEEKIGELQAIIDKYFFFRNEVIRGRGSREQERLTQFLIEVLSGELEEVLSPHPKRDAFVNYVYQILRPYVTPFSSEKEAERDVQIYIAVERAFGHNDAPTIRYHLFKLLIPDITALSWKDGDTVLPKLYEIYQQIEKDLAHPLADRVRTTIQKQIAPFLILRDLFEQNAGKVKAILTSESALQTKVDEACRRRYDESRTKLRRTGVRSFIYILLTKVVFAFILELPYDLYVAGKIEYLALGTNVIVPPVLMAIIILSVSVPGDDNTRRIFQLIRGIIDNDPDTLPVAGKGLKIRRPARSRSIVFSLLFSLLYFFTYFVSFGTIVTILTFFHFNVVSQLIFIFFVTLVTFFAFRIIRITQEYQVVSHENIFSHLADLFFLPIIRVGQWLSGEVLTRFNILIYILDFIIEMPFKAIVEVVDEWVRFVRLKKEEII